MSLDLDEIERLERAATSALWFSDPVSDGWGNLASFDVDCNAGEGPVCKNLMGEDAALIVILRNAAPAMIARIRELEAQVAERDARIGELREGLRPFGDDILGEDDDDFGDATPVVLKFGRSTVYLPITMGDLRTAARLTQDGETT